jgi:hypothetical protein
VSGTREQQIDRRLGQASCARTQDGGVIDDLRVAVRWDDIDCSRRQEFRRALGQGAHRQRTLAREDVGEMAGPVGAEVLAEHERRWEFWRQCRFEQRERLDPARRGADDDEVIERSIRCHSFPTYPLRLLLNTVATRCACTKHTA